MFYRIMITCWLPSILDVASGHDAIVATLHVVCSGIDNVAFGPMGASGTGVTLVLAKPMCPAIAHLASVVDLNTSIG